MRKSVRIMRKLAEIMRKKEHVVCLNLDLM